MGRRAKDDPRHREVIYQDDIIDEIASLDRIKQNGISRDLIALIIEDYQDRKLSKLIEGYAVDERGLGRTQFSIRRVSSNLNLNTPPFTVKCTTKLNPRPRAIIFDKLLKDTEEAANLRIKLSDGNIT